ncbi:MAG: lysozyme [Leptolyngbya sp. SIO1E4]|nr:lysozyme [Leptolyngbya sp. SIO1E4]
MSYTIQAKLDTWFKLSPAQGSSLADNEKEFFKAGTDFAIAAYAVEDNHLKITLGKDTQGQQIFIKGRNTWYLYGDAVELLHNGQAVDFKPKPAASCGSGNLPRAGVELIKEFEGYAKALPDGRAEAYADPIHGWQVPTIGYGTTVYPDGSKVKQGDVITREQAEEYLIDHIEHSTRAVLERIPTWGKMNDNQRAAIYSFAYNLGAAFYGGSGFQSITKVCDSPELWTDKTWITEQFVKYRNPGTSAEAGLRRRREAEANLFCA